MITCDIGTSPTSKVSLTLEETSIINNGWADIDISISVGAFTGNYTASIAERDIEPFIHEAQLLYEALSGKARFDPIEGQLCFELTGNGRGEIEVSGEAFDSFDRSNTLRFGFYIDQTYLPNIIKNMSKIHAEFRTGLTRQ